MLGIAVLGGLVGGAYGVLHDQVTYSIGPDYFTRFKFNQFAYADFGFPVRVFVGEIGFLATWWVGFFSAWFLARIAVPAWPPRVAFRRCVEGFGIIFGVAVTAATAGWLLARNHSPDFSNWAGMCASIGVENVPAFVTVAYIHNASYVGGLLGLSSAIGYLLVRKRWDAAAL